MKYVVKILKYQTRQFFQKQEQVPFTRVGIRIHCTHVFLVHFLCTHDVHLCGHVVFIGKYTGVIMQHKSCLRYQNILCDQEQMSFLYMFI